MKLMQLHICVQQNLVVKLQNYAKISFKRLYRNLSYLLFHKTFSKHSAKHFFKTFTKHLFATFSKTFKKQILTVSLRNNAKISSKRLYKYHFYLFLQHFSNKPYSNVKIIIAYFYIIKPI